MKKEVEIAFFSRPRTGFAGNARASTSCERRVVHSTELLDADGSVLIEHNGSDYLLRSLPGGGLILTKSRIGPSMRPQRSLPR